MTMPGFNIYDALTVLVYTIAAYFGAEALFALVGVIKRMFIKE